MFSILAKRCEVLCCHKLFRLSVHLCAKYQAHQKFDILIVIIFSICIVISTNKDLLLTKFSNNKIFYYLEKLSLPMYIYQWLIIDIMKELLIKLGLTISYPLMLLLCVLANIFFGIITIETVKIYNKNKSKIKNIFIIN